MATNDKRSPGNPANYSTPGGFLAAAMHAVPALRWGMGVGGLIAIAVLVRSWGVSVIFQVFAIAFFLIAMALFVVFSVLAKSTDELWLKWLAIAFTWFCMLVFMVTVVFTMGCAFFDWPKKLSDLTTRVEAAIKPTPVKPNWDEFWGRAQKLRGDYGDGLKNAALLPRVTADAMALAIDLESLPVPTASNERFYREYLAGTGYFFAALSAYAAKGNATDYLERAKKAQQRYEAAHQVVGLAIKEAAKPAPKDARQAVQFQQFRAWLEREKVIDEIRYGIGLAELLRLAAGENVRSEVRETFALVSKLFLSERVVSAEPIVAWYCSNYQEENAPCEKPK
jgi:hypothetical protein